MVVAMMMMMRASTAVSCAKGFIPLDGQCVLMAEYNIACATSTNCAKYFTNGDTQCDPANPTDCGWTFLAASNYCKSFGPGYSLVKISNQYQNNAYNTLKGEGAWSLSWVGASCKMYNMKGTQTAAWGWQADQSILLDGYNNFDKGVDPTTCTPGQCLSLGGTAYQGKWRGGDCKSHLGDAICAENFNTDSPTPAPNVKPTCEKGWVLFPNAAAAAVPGRVGPTKCYKMLADADIGPKGQEFTWNAANTKCKALGGALAKIEDVQTNIFINSALGNGAYSIQWIGAKCMRGTDGQYRFRWTKDNALMAAGYTNFPLQYGRKLSDGKHHLNVKLTYEDSPARHLHGDGDGDGDGGWDDDDDNGVEQEINPCNKKDSKTNPTGSPDMCVSSGGVGSGYDWRTGPCTGKMGDAICEKIPIGGSDDGPGANNNGKGKKSNGGSIAAGILVPLLLIGGAAGGFMYYKKNGVPNFGGANQAFISTSAYDPADATDFSTQPAGGAASL